MATLYVTHPACLEHDTGPGHPERPDRLRAIAKVMEHEAFAPLVRAEPAPADLDWIMRAHPRAYVEGIRDSRPKPGSGEQVRLDPDTVMSEGSWNAALIAVGAGLLAVDKVIAGEVKNAFCAVRPCGHHAEANRAMGFCLFNNVAIAAHYARAKHGAERVAVIDFDVHHGNGTQDIFWSDKNLFFASTHQMPLYPGTGAVSETGVGNIWNAPLRPGDGGDKFREACETRIFPALHNFAPDLLFISAGFDAHVNDPLANLRLTEADFAWVTAKLAEQAAKQSGGRIVSMLEGGYDLKGLAGSVAVHVKTLMDAGS